MRCGILNGTGISLLLGTGFVPFSVTGTTKSKVVVEQEEKPWLNMWPKRGGGNDVLLVEASLHCSTCFFGQSLPR